MILKNSHHKFSASVSLCLHHSQKHWKALPFFAFTGLAIFFLCNSSNIHAENLTIFVFEQKGPQKVPLEGAGVFLNGIFSESTDINGRVKLKDVPKGSHILEVKKTGFFTYETKAEIEFDEQREAILIPEIKNGELLTIIVTGGTGEKLTGVNVYLDDEILGQTKEGVFKVTGSLGKHDLKVEKEGYSPSQNIIEIKEYAETLPIILKKYKPVVMEKKDKVKAPAADKDKKTIASNDNKSKDNKDTSKHEGNIFLTVRVIEDTISGRVPVKNAKILINGYLCGETDKNGLFKKRHTPGKYVLRVEKTEFEHEEKIIELTSYTESHQVVLKKRPVDIVKRGYPGSDEEVARTTWEKIFAFVIKQKIDTIQYVIIGSIVGSLGFISLGVIIFTKRKGGKKDTIFIDSIDDEHIGGKMREIHVRFKLFKHRKGMSLIYLGENPFNARQKVVFKVLKEEHHNEDGLWLFDNEKKVHQILKNNGANNNQNHLAQYLYSGYLVRNKKQKVIAFEYIEGVSLFEIIGARKHTLQQAIEIGIWLCDPVMVVHHAGYCHLDLKPEHFIYKGQNRFTLIDIATALMIGDSVKTIFNSPPYSSPEQLRCRTVIDQRTDIYSLGVIIEELIHNSTIGYLNSALISVVQSIIGKMKNGNRDVRYQHITEVKASLEMLLCSFANT